MTTLPFTPLGNRASGLGLPCRGAVSDALGGNWRETRRFGRSGWELAGDAWAAVQWAIGI